MEILYVVLGLTALFGFAGATLFVSYKAMMKINSFVVPFSFKVSENIADMVEKKPVHAQSKTH